MALQLHFWLLVGLRQMNVNNSSLFKKLHTKILECQLLYERELQWANTSESKNAYSIPPVKPPGGLLILGL